MRTNLIGLLILSLAGIVVSGQNAPSQGRGGTNPDLVAQRNANEKALESVAIIERKLMVPMRDGKRMATDVYRPKDTLEEVPHSLRAHAVQLQLLGRAQRRARAI